MTTEMLARAIAAPMSETRLHRLCVLGQRGAGVPPRDTVETVCCWLLVTPPGDAPRRTVILSGRCPPDVRVTEQDPPG